jgi:hypothetical protein
VTRPIRSSEPASDEFSEAVRWYEARRSGLGGEFFDAVAATIALIETNPEIGTTISTVLEEPKLRFVHPTPCRLVGASGD